MQKPGEAICDTGSRRSDFCEGRAGDIMMQGVCNPRVPIKRPVIRNSASRQNWTKRGSALLALHPEGIEIIQPSVAPTCRAVAQRRPKAFGATLGDRTNSVINPEWVGEIGHEARGFGKAGASSVATRKTCIAARPTARDGQPQGTLHRTCKSKIHDSVGVDSFGLRQSQRLRSVTCNGLTTMREPRRIPDVNRESGPNGATGDGSCDG